MGPPLVTNRGGADGKIHQFLAIGGVHSGMKIFITGMSGLLGLNFARMAVDRFEVSGNYYSHPIAIDAVQAFQLDITSSEDVANTLSQIRPEVVIHTAGLTNVEKCEADPELAGLLHVEATANVASAAASVGSKFVHISTDHLFSGKDAWATETDEPAPLNAYAATKLRAERVAQSICPSALIIRTNFFGWGTSVRTSFSDWILRGLKQKDELTMFTDAYFTPILINDLVELIIQLFQAKETGIYHVAGRDRMSKYDYAIEMARVFGLPADNIRKTSLNDFQFKAQRPTDMSLSSEKMEKCLGVKMPTVVEGLEKLKRLGETGWAQSLEQAIQSETLNTALGD